MRKNKYFYVTFEWCSLSLGFSEASKGSTIQPTVETVILQVKKGKDSMQEKNTKAEQTLFQKNVSETDTTPKEATNAKGAVDKTQVKEDTAVKKTTTKGSSNPENTSRPTVDKSLPKQEENKKEVTRKGKTTPSASETNIKDGTGSRTFSTSDHLKDEPQNNATQSNVKKVSKTDTTISKGTGTTKTKTDKDILEQSTKGEKNVSQSSGHKPNKTGKLDTLILQTVDKKTDKTGKGTQINLDVLNRTIGAASDKTKSHHDKTTHHDSGISIKRTGGSGLGSVKAVNISSHSFTVTWLAPQGMFKNFTVIRREPQTEGDEDGYEDFEEEEALPGQKPSAARNATEVLVQSERTTTTASSRKADGSKVKADTKRISMVVPGNVRSVEFSNLRANTRYVLHIYGTAAQRRSKIHRVTATTGNNSRKTFMYKSINI